MFEPEDHTFVVCAYKENPYLEKTVKSLLDQSVLGEVVISTSTPNGSIQKVGEQLGVKVIVNPEPRLAGDDWNYGYDYVDTPLVTIAHQDDYYAPGFLENVLKVANQYSGEELALLFTDYYEIRNNEEIESNLLLNIKQIMNAPFRNKHVNGLSFVKRSVLRFGDPICCPATTYVKRNLGESIFDTTYKNSCDYKTFVDLASRPGKFVYIPKKLVGHRIYADSATTHNLAENIRKKEDAEILGSLWPRMIARAINNLYALSEKSNEL